ncbi:MAG: Bax inhibitor-1/YccA family protein [Gammaproteobacteria bacterium]
MDPVRSRSSNPALRALSSRGIPQAKVGEGAMTVGGTINKTIMLVALVVIAAAWVWSRYAAALPAGPSAAAEAISGYLIAGVIGGLVAAIATVFKPTWARVTGPLYAVLEGLAVGGISALLNNRYPGIVIEAVGLTFAVMIGMLVLYRTGIIKVTPKLQRGIMAATLGVFLFYGVSWLLTLFHVDTSMLFAHSRLSIIISLVIVAIAAFNLVLDFHFIDQGAQTGLPRYMEWYLAWGLTVTLVWLYLELLRLLASSRSS